MKTQLILLASLLLIQTARAGTDEVAIRKDIAYKPEEGLSSYELQRCKLDLYLPKSERRFPSLLWFHGGALKAGNKDDEFNRRIGQRLAQAGVAVAMANYRLSPQVKYPGYVEDAAAAFAWLRSHIAEHGGDPQRVFVGGHSAGAYLTLMIGLDERYLRHHGLETSAIAGLIPVSGQTMTHYTVREERGLNKDSIIADEAAPIHYVRKDAPPLLVLYAGNDLPARAEESQYLVAALKAAGHTRVSQQMIPERDHGSVAGNIPQPGDPAAAAILQFIGPPERQAVAQAAELLFGGYTWTVRSGQGGPGPNAWEEKNVWLDSSTNLHLKISERDGKWSCAEITMRQRLGFGRYQFQVAGRIDLLDDNVVLGLFNYPTRDVGPDATHEIDIEFARWGDAKNPIGNYTVWPVEKSLKQVSKSFPFALTGDHSTHRFLWSRTQVEFSSWHGHREDDREVFSRWSYSPSGPEQRISRQAMPVHINLWLFKGLPPKNGQEVEVVIRSFEFAPE
jgi:acetyl esterase/lipase